MIALQMSGSGDPMYNSGPQPVLSEGDVLIVLGEKHQVQNLREYAQTG